MNVPDMQSTEVRKGVDETCKRADDDTKAPVLTASAEDKARDTSEMTKDPDKVRPLIVYHPPSSSSSFAYR